MINKINNSKISGVIRDTNPKDTKTPQGNSEKNIDVLLQLSNESLIQKSKQQITEDSKAVERARQLLLSGQLDNPENISKAAENIIDLGI